MEGSTVVNEWMAKREAMANRAMIVRLGEKRFGAPSAEQRAALDATTDLDHLV